MLVRCIVDDVGTVDRDTSLGRYVEQWFGRDTQALPVTRGRVYVVYGLRRAEGSVHYFIADDDFKVLGYPVPYMSELFETVDPAPSVCWSEPRKLGAAQASQMVTFREWAVAPRFYEELVDGGSEVGAVFRKWRALMDSESAAGLGIAFAESIGAGWFLCSHCGDAWQCPESAGLVRCPMCATTLAIPLPAEWGVTEPEVPTGPPTSR